MKTVKKNMKVLKPMEKLSPKMQEKRDAIEAMYRKGYEKIFSHPYLLRKHGHDKVTALRDEMIRLQIEDLYRNYNSHYKWTSLKALEKAMHKIFEDPTLLDDIDETMTNVRVEIVEAECPCNTTARA